MVPENVLSNFIGGPDSVKKLAQIDPRVQQYAPWFIQLGEHIKAMLGMPSTVGDLYEGDESGNVAQSQEKFTVDNETDIPVTGDTER